MSEPLPASQYQTSPPPDSLPPGRELDALVAEKVMGWRRGEERVISKQDGVQVGVNPVWHAPGKTRRLVVEHKLPHYSTDIAAAWLVVEQMNSNEGVTAAKFDQAMMDIFLWTLTREKAAHAICLAALKAADSLPIVKLKQ